MPLVLQTECRNAEPASPPMQCPLNRGNDKRRTSPGLAERRVRYTGGELTMARGHSYIPRATLLGASASHCGTLRAFKAHRRGVITARTAIFRPEIQWQRPKPQGSSISGTALLSSRQRAVSCWSSALLVADDMVRAGIFPRLLPPCQIIHAASQPDSFYMIYLLQFSIYMYAHRLSPEAWALLKQEWKARHCKNGTYIYITVLHTVTPMFHGHPSDKTLWWVY